MESHEEAYKRFYKRDADGHLIFCDMKVDDILKNLTNTERGEPIYIVGTKIIEFQAKAAEEALAKSNTRRTYAIKANSSPAVLQIIRKQGVGAEVASVEELKLAIESGFDPKDIVADGIGKTRQYFELALDKGVSVINCNDKIELELLNQIAGEKGLTPRVGLRVSPDVESAGESHHISTADDSSKFGIKLADARKIYLSDEYKNLNLSGIHVHLGSNIKDRTKFEKGYGTIVNLAEELNAAGKKLEYIDFGGGVGVPYTPYGALGLPTSKDDKNLITIAEYGDILNQQRERLNKINPQLEMVSELGRYYIASAQLYLCQVTGENVKGDHTHINTTGNMGQFIRPALYQAKQIAFPMIERPGSETYKTPLEKGPGGEMRQPEKSKIKVVGNMCESDDIIALDCEGLQKQHKGDYLCFPTAGAYNPTMQLANYNQIGTCGTVLVHTDGKAYLNEHPVSGVEYMYLRARGGATPPELQIDSLKHGPMVAYARRLATTFDPTGKNNWTDTVRGEKEKHALAMAM
jgi:diaminopimelate decarboxylase